MLLPLRACQDWVENILRDAEPQSILRVICTHLRDVLGNTSEKETIHAMASGTRCLILELVHTNVTGILNIPDFINLVRATITFAALEIEINTLPRPVSGSPMEPNIGTLMVSAAVAKAIWVFCCRSIILNYRQYLTAPSIGRGPPQHELQRRLYEIARAATKLDCTLLYTILRNDFTVMIGTRMQGFSTDVPDPTYILQRSDLSLFSHSDGTSLSLSTDVALLALLNPHKLHGTDGIVVAIRSLLMDEISTTAGGRLS